MSMDMDRERQQAIEARLEDLRSQLDNASGPEQVQLNYELIVAHHQSERIHRRIASSEARTKQGLGAPTAENEAATGHQEPNTQKVKQFHPSIHVGLWAANIFVVPSTFEYLRTWLCETLPTLIAD